MLEFWKVKALESRWRARRLQEWRERERQDTIEAFFERWTDAYYQRDLLTQVGSSCAKVSQVFCSHAPHKAIQT